MAVTKTPAKLSSVVESVQKFYGVPNKTFDKPPSAASIKRMEMLSYLLYVIEGYRKDGKRRNVHIVGPAGIGKTRTVFAVAEACGIKVVYLPAANIDPETLGLPVIVPIEDWNISDGEHNETIEYRLRKHLLEPGEKIIVIDEKRQSAPGMLSIFMELESEGSIANNKIPDLIGVVVLDNHAGDDYGDLVLEDLAQADRIGTLPIDASKTAWEYGLAISHPDLDLKAVLNIYNRLPLDEKSREMFMPRILDHIITALENGLNAIYGWPIYPTGRMPLLSRAGEDILDATLDKIAAALSVVNPPVRADDFKRAVKLSVTKGIDVIAYSVPGIGKTSLVKAMLNDMGVNAAYMSIPTVSADELNYTMPSKDGTYVTVVPRGEIWSKNKTIGVFDEVTRGQVRTMNAVNEIINEHTCGGQPLPNYLASIMLSNLPTAAGHVMDVNEITLPFATRPDLSFILTIEDTGALEWLVEEYGDSIIPFVEWYRMDLNDELRGLVSPRCLERMLDHHNGGQDLQRALPYIEDAFVPVPISTLLARLGGRPQISFLNLVEETDEYEKRLREVESITDAADEGPGEMLRMEVYMALMNAELPSLQKHEEVCVRMIRVLGRRWLYELLKTAPTKWQFWSDILVVAFPD
jgi:MoxR-like ATPase